MTTEPYVNCALVGARPPYEKPFAPGASAMIRRCMAVTDALRDCSHSSATAHPARCHLGHLLPTRDIGVPDQHQQPLILIMACRAIANEALCACFGPSLHPRITLGQHEKPFRESGTHALTAVRHRLQNGSTSGVYISTCFARPPPNWTGSTVSYHVSSCPMMEATGGGRPGLH